jgi:hypothetical protein
MRFSRSKSLLLLAVSLISAISCFAWYRASARDKDRGVCNFLLIVEYYPTGDNTPSVKGTTHAIHLTSADQTKSIGQLISEQHSEPIPNQAICSFHFLVDPENNGLIFPRVEAFQPPGFQLGILPGDDKKINIPEIPIKGEAALNLFFVKAARSN